MEYSIMSEISALIVKKLRDQTGAGMMDCKKALLETAVSYTHLTLPTKA